MNRVLFSLFGFEIQAYGFWISIGLLSFWFFVSQDQRFSQLKLKLVFGYIILFGLLTSFVGGKLLFWMTEPNFSMEYSPFEFFAPWNGGFSILGSIIATSACLPFFLGYLQIPIIQFLDLIATYAPLLQSISRIGCFYAGCCYGIQTALPWGVHYEDQNSFAPLFTILHPTQLYSSLLLFLIFLFLYQNCIRLRKQAGLTFFLYLLLVSAERFLVDFWRADRHFPSDKFGFSGSQYVAFALFCFATLLVIFFRRRDSLIKYVTNTNARRGFWIDLLFFFIFDLE
jgi:phosphatidylglycerol:prolipoprotein diacylglycerol transferase